MTVGEEAEAYARSDECNRARHSLTHDGIVSCELPHAAPYGHRPRAFAPPADAHSAPALGSEKKFVTYHSSSVCVRRVDN